MKEDTSFTRNIFKRIGMPTNYMCYETMSQIYKAVILAYFLGRSDEKNNKSNDNETNNKRAI